MTTFPRMADILPVGISGKVRLVHFTVSEADAKFTMLRAACNGRDEYVPPGTYVRLVMNHGVMMSDTPMEQRSNREVVYHARGHVLIAGLGLGMILHPICEKPEVTKVTVVELDPDVIKLVSPSLPAKVEVVQGDIFEWKPAKGTKYDCIYMDIWQGICEDNLKGMATLHRRFAKCKAPGAWMGSWQRNLLLSRRASSRRSTSIWGR